jgi:hypothetical protein
VSSSGSSFEIFQEKNVIKGPSKTKRVPEGHDYTFPEPFAIKLQHFLACTSSDFRISVCPAPSQCNASVAASEFFRQRPAGNNPVTAAGPSRNFTVFRLHNEVSLLIVFHCQKQDPMSRIGYNPR